MDKDLVYRSIEEITVLRKQNEILQAKVDVVNVFKAALLGPSIPSGMMHPDVLHLLHQKVHEIEVREKNEKQEVK